MAKYTTRYHGVREKLEGYEPRNALARLLWEFVLFGVKQAWACLFGGALLALLLATKFCWPADAPLARYDFLFLCALALQAALLAFRLETLREARVILIFHVVGTLMELFKTQAGSWTYPEPSLLRIGGVPLFSGFMYAAVGSYIARVTRIFDLRYSAFPSRLATAAIAVLVYANFYTHHFVPDVRFAIFALVAWTFAPTWVHYRAHRQHRRMPLLLGFGLVTLFIWAAENIGTFTSMWTYPHQAHGWHMVHWPKFGSWYLLMIVSFVLVTSVHPPAPPGPGSAIRE